jgi:hypothetical protein
MSGPPGIDRSELAPTLARVLAYELIEDPTALLVILRAELDGLAPESLVRDGPSRPLALLSTWLSEQERGPNAPDPRIVSMLVGAAMFGLAGATPWLASAVGLEGQDPGVTRRQCMEVLIGLVGAAAGPRG